MKNSTFRLTTRMRATLLRIALLFAVCTIVIGLGIGARNMIADETSQAHAFVGDGQRAVARGDRGAAVLDFERARLLAPRADFVRSAIAATDMKDDDAPALVRVARLVTSREWTAIVVASGWISALGLAFVIMRRSSRFASRLALAAGGVFAVGMAATAVISSASAIAVVMPADEHLLVAPYASATAESALPSGTVVVVGSPYEGFVQVQAGDGAKGWVRKNSIKVVANQNQDS